MKVKRMVKRLFAVGTGVAMLGATAMGAMAADLSDYPTMFVEAGVFNGLLVVGERAMPIDNLAMTDIAASMKVASGSGGATVAVSGDSWQVGTSSKKLEIANNNVSDTTIAGERFRDITTFLDEEDLDALATGKWVTNENEYEFNQFLYFDNKGANPERSNIVKYTESDDDVTADHLFIANTGHIARFLLEFTSTAQSDVTDSSGTSDTTGTYLDDFENTDLSMMGKDYTVVLARRTAASPQYGVKLTLMAGAARDTILEGESKTYTVKDKTYEVSLTYTDSDEAKFVVNGEATNKLKVGETYVLSDGSEIGVSEVLYQSYAGGVHSSTFFVGAKKTELRDDLILDGIGSHDLKVGSEDIDGAEVIITGTDDNTTLTITTIGVNVTAEDDYFVAAGKKLSDVIAAAGEEKEALTWADLDIEYQGLSTEETHDIRLKTSGTRRYKLTLFDGDNNAVNLPVAYAISATNLTLGEEAWDGNARSNQKRLILNESSATSYMDIYKDDYFVITGGSATDGSGKSYLLQYKSADRQTKTSPKIKFKNEGSGETLEYSVSTISAGTTGTVATIKLGGYSFIVQNRSSAQADDFNVAVDLNGNGAFPIDSGLTTFIDSYGSQWTFSPIDISNGSVSIGTAIFPNSFEWSRATLNANDYDNVLPMTVAFNITATTGPEVRASLSPGITLLTPDGETEVSYGYTSMGSFLKFEAPASDPQELTYTYPKNQRIAQVYVTSGATKTSSSSSGNMVAVEVVDATRLDSEVADYMGQNLIVVGGPCVNTVAAKLMGNPADCAQGFTPGKARVKLFEHANGNMAMLVAGYSGADTRLAGKVVANRPGDLFGSEVEVEGTTSSDATVSAPK
ncbi:MAG: hypothetical protein Q8R37_00460 [Nanoarchaeota archaeon]|nr:hypothetical protein [Nanoarchaeota archaeon]